MNDNLTVLLVDDDPNIQSMFQMVLDHHGIDLFALRTSQAPLSTWPSIRLTSS